MLPSEDVNIEGYLTYHFINSSGSAERHRKRKLESQKYGTEARRHVNQRTSSSRRLKRSRPTVIQLELIPRLDVDILPLQSRRQSRSEAIDNSPEQTYGLPNFQTESESRYQTVRRCQHFDRRPIPSCPLSGKQLDTPVRWPVEVSVRMRYLFHHINLTDCPSIRSFRSTAQPLLTADAGIFYHALAISAFCLNARHKHHSLICEAFHYYAKGIASINERLGNESERQGEGIVASILGNAILTQSSCAARGWCWEIPQAKPGSDERDDDPWIHHLHALKTILDERGGVEVLDSKSSLRYLLYLVDLGGSASRDIVPFFPPPLHLLPTPPSHGQRKPDISTTVTTWIAEFPTQHHVINIFLDLDTTIGWLSEQLTLLKADLWRQPGLDAARLIPLIYRCVELGGRKATKGSRQNPEMAASYPDRAFRNALRHAIVLFLAPIRRKFGPPASGTDLHLSKMISAFEICLDHTAMLKLHPLCFWMLLVGAMEACHLERECDEDWFFGKILDACINVTGSNFEDVELTIRHSMAEMIWLEDAVAEEAQGMMERLRGFVEGRDREKKREQRCHGGSIDKMAF